MQWEQQVPMYDMRMLHAFLSSEKTRHSGNGRPQGAGPATGAASAKRSLARWR